MHENQCASLIQAEKSRFQWGLYEFSKKSRNAEWFGIYNRTLRYRAAGNTISLLTLKPTDAMGQSLVRTILSKRFRGKRVAAFDFATGKTDLKPFDTLRRTTMGKGVGPNIAL